ncbi:hypothetical protein FJ366_02195 [Candidatus Dependentiae bacterium]|nr:hypothetical protein [Candidatus Dependentiae bacterium]
MSKQRALFLSAILFLGWNFFRVEATAVGVVEGSKIAQASQVVRTGTARLTDEEIAKINKEAAEFAKLGQAGALSERIKIAANIGKNVVMNPVDSLYSVVAPLAMFVIGFFEQAAKQMLQSNYMDQKLSILVDPSKQWSALVAKEKDALRKLGGVKTTTQDTQVPSSKGIAQLGETGWNKQWKGGNVGIVYDFGFGGAGDDLTQPLGFIRSEVSGKYYSRPVRGQISPASMTMNNKSYRVDFRSKPFVVLIPKVLGTLFSANVVNPTWNRFLNFTQLDPMGIFSMKVLLLISTAFRNSFSKVQPIKTTDKTQTASAASWTYTSVKDGAKYPGVENIYTELTKLIQRLKITPDIKRTIAANNGETVPSKWDLNKIVYMQDINLGKLLLSILPQPLKMMLNLFKIKVNFYEYQSVIDKKTKTAVSDIDLLYGRVRGYGMAVDDLAKMKASGTEGEYVDSFIARLRMIEELAPKILWKDGSQTFTDTMKLFFLIRRLSGELFVGIEPIVTTYGTGETQDLKGADSSPIGMQDSSVLPEYAMGMGGYYKDIDFDLLQNKILPARVDALSKYIDFVKKYTSSFVSSKVGDVMIDSRYRISASADASVGGVDDYARYFPQAAMKQILNDYVSLVGNEVSAVLSSLDAQMNSFKAVVAQAKTMSEPYNAAESAGEVLSDQMINAKIDALDKLVSEMRRREARGQEVGIYPVGSEEKLLKIVEVPGVIYLAYCLDYLSNLLNTPFDGDKQYHFDDSFFDDDSSYLRLISILMRANQDLSRAARVVSMTEGPVEFKDAAGKYYMVPSGSSFYTSALKVYDQNVLVQEQNMRDALARFGDSSAQYKQATETYLNNKKLLSAKKKEMNNVLRTFEFDRRAGFGANFDLKNMMKQKSLQAVGNTVDVAGASAVVSVVAPGSAAAAQAEQLATQVSTAQQSASVQTSADGSEDVSDGVVGRLDDGSAVYSYERSVNDFLQDELASLAFRTKMVDLQSLKDLVMAITGISAEDLWTGVESRKRLLLILQQEAAQASLLQQSVDEAAVIDQGAADEKLTEGELMTSADDVDAHNVDTSIFASQQNTATQESKDSLAALPDASVAANSDSAVAVRPVVPAVGPIAQTPLQPVVQAALPAVLPVVEVAPVQPVTTLTDKDFDLVVVAANGEGLKSFNDEVGLIKLTSDLDALYAQTKKAIQDKNGVDFSESLKDLVFSCAQVVTPTEQVKSLFVETLGKIINLLSFVQVDDAFSTYKAMSNLLAVTNYLSNGLLSTQSAALAPLAENLRSWLKSN